MLLDLLCALVIGMVMKYATEGGACHKGIGLLDPSWVYCTLGSLLDMTLPVCTWRKINIQGITDIMSN